MTIHECKEHGAGPCLNENLIGEIAEANATLANRISALEAENAALKAGDAMLKAALKDADEQNAALKAERDEALKAARIPSHFKHGLAAWINLLTASSEETDDALGDFGAEVAELQAQVAALKAERDEAQKELADTPPVSKAQWRATQYEILTVRAERSGYKAQFQEMYRMALAARQSRARLVRLVRALRNEVRNHKLVNEMCEDDLADVQDQRDAAIESRKRLVNAVRCLRAQLTTAWSIEAQAEAEREAMQSECDAARAWAAAWKRAAKLRRARVGYRQDAEWLCVDRRNRRARRAAEAMERQP